jgi:hypothetical protein
MHHYIIKIFIIFVILFIIFFIINKALLKKYYENFNSQNDLISNETVECAIKNSFTIIDKENTFRYNNIKLTALIGQTIIFNVINNLDNQQYTIIRYPDFKNEFLRHSIKNLNEYFIFLENNFIKKNKNYIFDFIGYHGIIDDKVRIWIKLKEYYGRDVANSIMPKTYLIPNDYELFMKEYRENKKYILKNSFGGGRSSIKITKSKDEIINVFDYNKSHNYNPYLCEDAKCHNNVKYNIIQDFIIPTFLINGHKLGIRLYLTLIYDKNIYKKLLWKNGFCYYSNKKYIDNENIENNVVGTIKQIKQLIEDNNFPITYIEFKEYCKNNVDDYNIKLNNLESNIVHNLGCIIKSNEKDLIYFNNYSNIKKFTTFAFDIEFDNNFNPVIFEGNFYFTRSFPNTKYGIETIKMYDDIFYEMNLSKKSNYGFLHI